MAQYFPRGTDKEVMIVPLSVRGEVVCHIFLSHFGDEVVGIVGENIARQKVSIGRNDQ